MRDARGGTNLLFARISDAARGDRSTLGIGLRILNLLFASTSAGANRSYYGSSYTSITSSAPPKLAAAFAVINLDIGLISSLKGSCGRAEGRVTANVRGNLV